MIVVAASPTCACWSVVRRSAFVKRKLRPHVRVPPSVLGSGARPDKFVLSYAATGCANTAVARSASDQWKKQTDAAALKTMHDYCVAATSGVCSDECGGVMISERCDSRAALSVCSVAPTPSCVVALSVLSLSVPLSVCLSLSLCLCVCVCLFVCVLCRCDADRKDQRISVLLACAHNRAMLASFANGVSQRPGGVWSQRKRSVPQGRVLCAGLPRRSGRRLRGAVQGAVPQARGRSQMHALFHTRRRLLHVVFGRLQ